MAAISGPPPLPAPGSGGKIRIARHLPPAISPYLRPAPATSPDSPNRGWLFTAARSVASTAGKLLLGFLSENSSALSRSSGTFSNGNGENSECEDVNGLCCVSSKMTVDLNTNGNLPVATMNPDKESQSITQDRSRTKLAIEFLLLQETYTREECIKLTKIIQSRVVDDLSDGPITKEGKDALLKGHYSQSVGNATPPSETLVPLSQMRKSPHVFPYSANGQSLCSPKSSVLHACSPDVQKTAIMEAKKWLQEKKSEMSSKSDLDHGPCNLNTDMLSYGNGGDMSSPVDLAKSYMQRPLWASPSLLNVTFKSPSPVRLQFPDDEIHHAMSSQPSMETAKRSSDFMKSSDIHEEIRRIPLKLAENTSEPSSLKQNESSPRLLANVSGDTSLVAHERLELVGVSHNTDSAQVGNTVTGPGNLNPQIDVDNAGSEDREKRDFSLLGNELCAACPILSLQDHNQDLGDACLSQQKVGSGTASLESTVPTTVPNQNIGDTVGELTSNREVLVSQEIWCSMPSHADRPDNNKDAPMSKSSSEMCSAAEKVVHDAFEPHQAPCFSDASSFSDLKLQQAYDHKQTGSTNITVAGESSSSRSSLLVELNAKSGGKSLKKSQKQGSLNHEVPGVVSSLGVRKLRGEASMEVPPDLKSNDIEVGSRTRNQTNAIKGHANGNRRKEVGYKRRRVKGQ